MNWVKYRLQVPPAWPKPGYLYLANLTQDRILVLCVESYRVLHQSYVELRTDRRPFFGRPSIYSVSLCKTRIAVPATLSGPEAVADEVRRALDDATDHWEEMLASSPQNERHLMEVLL